jgi:hypothetical protein
MSGKCSARLGGEPPSCLTPAPARPASGACAPTCPLCPYAYCARMPAYCARMPAVLPRAPKGRVGPCIYGSHDLVTHLSQ